MSRTPSQSVGTVVEAAELLDLLLAAPASRAVFRREDRLVYPRLHVCACDEALRPSEILAVLTADGSARVLLDSALRLDYGGALDEWRSHPLRYRRFDRMWLLSEHPLAPRHLRK